MRETAFVASLWGLGCVCYSEPAWLGCGVVFAIRS